MRFGSEDRGTFFRPSHTAFLKTRLVARPLTAWPSLLSPGGARQRWVNKSPASLTPARAALYTLVSTAGTVLRTLSREASTSLCCWSRTTP